MREDCGGHKIVYYGCLTLRQAVTSEREGGPWDAVNKNFDLYVQWVEGPLYVI